MSSRRRSLFRPRSILLLLALAGLAAFRSPGRLQPARGGLDDDQPVVRQRLLEPWLGLALVGGCLLVVAGYLGWAAIQARSETRAVAIALTQGDPDRAPAILTRYGCGGCHTIPGVPGADGKVAAPLKDLRARVYVGGVLPNTADNLQAWIVDPPAFSPRTAMPKTGITEAEARDVAAYLYMQ